MEIYRKQSELRLLSAGKNTIKASFERPRVYMENTIFLLRFRALWNGLCYDAIK